MSFFASSSFSGLDTADPLRRLLLLLSLRPLRSAASPRLSTDRLLDLLKDLLRVLLARRRLLDSAELLPPLLSRLLPLVVVVVY